MFSRILKYFFSGATLFVVVFLVTEVPSRVLAVDGVSIGSVYQCAHDFRGEVFVKNDRQITIKGMNYDGKGPAAWFHGQLKGSKGIYTADPDKYVTLPYPDATCDRLTPGKVYKDEDVSLTLPRPIYDFESIGILCYQYCHNFGHVIIPKGMNFTVAPEDIVKTEECPKPDYKACALPSRNGDFKPNCPAGASQLIPGLLTFIAGGVIAVFHLILRN